MKDERCKDVIWRIRRNPDGTVLEMDAVLAVLMDIRDELKRINTIIQCSNFIAIPGVLCQISHNTAKPRRKAKA